MCALTGAGLAPMAGKPGGLAGPMSFLMTVAAAAALLVLSISGVNANGAFEVLWGSILATRAQDLAVIAVVAAVVIALFLRFRRPLGLLLFDRELAACSGVRVGAAHRAAPRGDRRLDRFGHPCHRRTAGGLGHTAARSQRPQRRPLVRVDGGLGRGARAARQRRRVSPLPSSSTSRPVPPWCSSPGSSRSSPSPYPPAAAHARFATH